MRTTTNWFQRQCDEYDEAQLRSTYLSDDWNSYHFTPNNLGVEGQRKLLSTFENFARMMDVDRSLTIRFANEKDVATACASFRHIYNGRFEKPLILINSGLFANCGKNFVDVATGVFLHELGHILYTRKFFDPCWIEENNVARTFRNILEDARIEELIIENAPGWAPYIYAARKQLLDQEWFIPAFANWDQSCDTDKITLIVSCFIRAPHLLRDAPDYIKQWCDLGGRCIYDAIAKLMPERLESELDVADIACDIYYMVRQYANMGIAHLSSRPLEQVTRVERERLRIQIDSDASDYLYDKQKTLENVQDLIERIVARVGSMRSLEDLLTRHNIVSVPDSKSIGRTRWPFMQMDAEDMWSIPQSTKSSPGKKDRLQVRLPDNLRSSDIQIEKVTESSDASRYRDAAIKTRALSRRLSNVFDIKPEVANRRRSGQISGRLDSKQLWRASFETTIFSTSVAEKPSPVQLVLLLDASGSMEIADRYKRALETAVLVNEAFLRNPRVNVRVFGHSTSGTATCTLKDYGDGSQAKHTLSAYRPDDANFDYLAIRAVTANFDRLRSKKILISISDGAPCLPYSADCPKDLDAFEATKKAVEEARMRGWTVMGVDIGSEAACRIYGKDWTVRFDASTLSTQIASLVGKLLRRALA